MEACSDVQGEQTLLVWSLDALVLVSLKQTLVVCEKSNHMKDGRRCSTDIVVILVGPLYPLNPDWTLER